MWCSHANPPAPAPGKRNATVLPFLLPGCRDVYDMFGTKTARICPSSAFDRTAAAAAAGTGGRRHQTLVAVVWGEFRMKTDPQYLLPLPGRQQGTEAPSDSNDHILLAPSDGGEFCLKPNR
jgi:hypothetical protein